MEIIPYAGWSRCARLVAGDTELIVTLDVGPRVIRYGFIGGENAFFENPRDLGLTGGDEYRGYGGHRLWIAPEDRERTYTPDNDAVESEVLLSPWSEARGGGSVSEANSGGGSVDHGPPPPRQAEGPPPIPLGQGEENSGVLFRSAPDRYGIQKEIRIFPCIRESFTPLPSSPGTSHPDEEWSFRVEHLVTNHGPETVELAPWALTVMAPGGTCYFPQPDFSPHGESLLPVRPLVLWPYTDMSDPRWTWGRRLVRLRFDPDRGPQKAGTFVSQGWAAYANRGQVFLKRFPADPLATYPDMGCNFETFTRHDMLEVESLGPLARLDPGQSTSHWEEWRLFRGEPPEDEDECAEWLSSS